MCEAVILLVHNKLNSLSSYRKFPPRALEFQLNNGISGVDESKNELKTIVSTKIENISEYLRHLNTEPVYRDISKLNRGFFASENRKIFPRFLLHLLKKRLDESTVYFFHRLYNLSQVGNALYITSLDKNQETLGLYDDLPPFCSTRRRPFTAISIDKNLIDTARYDKIS